jgi:uncharacterized membrane protein YraQ (UPF0718 family)
VKRLYINELIRVYNENFGFWHRVKDTLNRSKLILVPLCCMVVSAICFYLLFIVDNIPYRVFFMITSILLIIGSIIWGDFIQKKTINNKYDGIQNLEKHKLEKVEGFLKENLKIEKLEHYTLLDTLVTKQIEEIKENKSFPFLNTIRQLLMAVLITGLLSYSFKQLTDGNSILAQSLLALYIMILGTILIVGSFIYSTREFTRKYKLKQISKLITELQLRMSLKN